MDMVRIRIRISVNVGSGSRLGSHQSHVDLRLGFSIEENRIRKDDQKHGEK